MRTYRIEFIGQMTEFNTCIEAATEYHAIKQGREDYPGFSIGHVVEVMGAADHE